MSRADKDFAETLGAGDQEAYNKKAEELHAQTDTGKLQADLKKKLQVLYADARDPEEEVESVLLMNKIALLNSYVGAMEETSAALDKLSEQEQKVFDLERDLAESEKRCGDLETARKERDTALAQAGVINLEAKTGTND